jgi:hypothetical protein
MSPEERRQLSRLLILRPHPWAYHPIGRAERAERAGAAQPRSRIRGSVLSVVGDEPPPVGGWREYVSSRLAALERQILRLGHTSRDWLF